MSRIAISPKMMGAAIILVSLLVGGGAAYVGQAFASPPPYTPAPIVVTGSGTGTFTLTSSTCVGGTGPTCVGGYTLYNQVASFQTTGGLSGTFVCTGQFVANPDGTFEFYVPCTFTGTVTGGFGTGTMSDYFTGSGSGSSFTSQGELAHGTRGLFNIQSILFTTAGTVTLISPTTSSATFTVTAIVTYNR
jgi:hypothetical protein